MFILTCSLWGYIPPQWGRCELKTSWSHCVCNQEDEREQEVGLGFKESRPAPNGSLPLASLHLSSLPNYSPCGDRVSKHMSLQRTLHIQLSRVYRLI